MWVRKGYSTDVRRFVFERDHGVCAHCGASDVPWQADHIIAVVNGGGGCGLDGYQTLCVPCHKKKTIIDLKCGSTPNPPANSTTTAS